VGAPHAAQPALRDERGPLVPPHKTIIHSDHHKSNRVQPSLVSSQSFSATMLRGQKCHVKARLQHAEMLSGISVSGFPRSRRIPCHPVAIQQHSWEYLIVHPMLRLFAVPNIDKNLCLGVMVQLYKTICLLFSLLLMSY